MQLDIRQHEATHTGGRIRRGTILEIGIYSCDHCQTIFEKRISQMKDKRYHFCSRKCCYAERKPGGLVSNYVKQQNLKKFGVENVFQSPDVKQQIEATLVERYGVTSSAQIEHVRLATSKSNVKRWAHMSTTEKDAMQRRKRATCIKRYAVPHPMQSPEVCQRATQALLNKGYLRSRSERLLESALISIFDVSDVMIQAWQNDVAGRNHPVDFYIKSLRIMIEFDGIYWHDQPDVKQRDAEFEKWCMTHEKKLLRITETDLCFIMQCNTKRLPRKITWTKEAIQSLRDTIESAALHGGVVRYQRTTMPPTTASDTKLEP